MQILKVILYGKNDKIREIKFELNKFNIIVGESKTGKTVILDIIDYCLCSDDFNVADGIVRENVEWFGLLLQFENEQLFLARKNVKQNKEGSSAIYLMQGVNINYPLKCNFEENTTTKKAKKILNEKLNIIISGNKDETDPSIRISLAYCFQSQNEIASKTELFHKQKNNFIKENIKKHCHIF